MSVRVAVGQIPFAADVVSNVAAAVRAASAAQQLGARLLVLPELALSGYRLAGLEGDQDGGGRVLSLDDPRTAPVQEVSTGIAVLVGAAVATSAGTVNAVLLFQGGRTPALAYAKQHLWGQEGTLFTAGGDSTVLEVAGLRVGLGVCFDAGFPEHSRAYARVGVHLISYSSSFLVGDEASRYDIYHGARALESGCYVAVSDTCGVDGADTFYGHSRVHGPRGDLLADAGTQEAVVTADIDVDLVAATRVELPYLALLRPTYLATIPSDPGDTP